MELELRFTFAAAVATLLCMVASAGTAVADLPPSGRTYFTTMLGLANNIDESYQIEPTLRVGCRLWRLGALGMGTA